MDNPYKHKSKLNVQPEKGTRRIANDLFIALTMADLSGAEYKLINIIISETWGYQRQSTILTFKDFQIFGNISRSTVIRTVKLLEAKCIIIINRKLVSGQLPVCEYQINKYYDTWMRQTSVTRDTPTSVRLYTSLQLKLVSQIKITGVRNALKLVSDLTPPTYSIKKEKKEKCARAREALPSNHKKPIAKPLSPDTILTHDDLDEMGKKLVQKMDLNNVKSGTRKKTPPDPSDNNTQDPDGIFS